MSEHDSTGDSVTRRTAIESLAGLGVLLTTGYTASASQGRDPQFWRQDSLIVRSVHPQVATVDGRQYVLAAVNPGWDRTQTVLEVGGTTYDGRHRVGGVGVTETERGWNLHANGADPFTLAVFELPTDLTASAGQLRHPPSGTTVRLPQELLSVLGRSPDFTVESVSTPDSVAPGANFVTNLTVRNDGGTGVFNATMHLNDSPVLGLVNEEVGAGETTTVPVGAYAPSDGTATVRFDLGYDTVETTFSVS